MLYRAVLLLVVILLAWIPSHHTDAQPEGGLQVLKTFGYLDENNYYVVVGEVMNGGTPVKFVEIVVTFFDQDFNTLTVVSGSLAIETLNASQISPFSIVLREADTSALVKSYTVNVANYNTAQEKPKKLEVIYHDIDVTEDIVTMQGRLANDGTANSKDSKIMVVLYNTIGEPVRLASAFTDPRNILALGSGLFFLNIDVSNVSSIAGYAIYSESAEYAQVDRFVKNESIPLHRLTETVSMTDFTVFNSNSQPTGYVPVGEAALFTVDLTSNAPERQQYLYILQVKDQNGFVVSLSSAVGHIAARENSKATIAWVPEEAGAYAAEAFVWNSLEEAVPLSFKTMSRALSVS